MAELLRLLDRMAGAMVHITSEQMLKDDLSPNRYNALRTLDSENQLTMSGLAERLRVSTAAVTSIVDKLEAERFVRRVRNKQDRRQIFVQIAPHGRKALHRALDVRADLIRYLLENLTPAMRQSWLELYRAIGAIIARKAQEKAAQAPPSRS